MYVLDVRYMLYKKGSEGVCLGVTLEYMLWGMDVLHNLRMALKHCNGKGTHTS